MIEIIVFQYYPVVLVGMTDEFSALAANQTMKRRRKGGNGRESVKKEFSLNSLPVQEEEETFIVGDSVLKEILNNNGELFQFLMKWRSSPLVNRVLASSDLV